MSATQQPDIAADLAHVVEIVDAALLSRGLPLYSRLVAESALHAADFDRAVHERAVGLVKAENRRLRIALMVALQDVLAVQALLAKGNRSEAELAIFAMLPELRAATHKMKPGSLAADVASLEAARERRDGAR